MQKSRKTKVKRSAKLARRSWAGPVNNTAGFLLSAALGLMIVAWSQGDSPATPDELREQTVHVLSFAGEEDDGSGSGTVLRGSDGSNYVFTAAHVVPDSCDQRIVIEVHPLDLDLPLIQLCSEVVWVDRQRDFALIKVLAPFTFARCAVLGPRRPRTGQWVQHVGFMHGHSFPHAYSTGQVACWDSRAAKWLNIGCDTAALMAMPGSSGGPVFDPQGRLVGVMVGITAYGASFYVPLFQVDASLKESKIGVKF